MWDQSRRPPLDWVVSDSEDRTYFHWRSLSQDDQDREIDAAKVLLPRVIPMPPAWLAASRDIPDRVAGDWNGLSLTEKESEVTRVATALEGGGTLPAPRGWTKQLPGRTIHDWKIKTAIQQTEIIDSIASRPLRQPTEKYRSRNTRKRVN